MTNKIKSIIGFCDNKFYDENNYCGIGLKTEHNNFCLKWKHSEEKFDKQLEMTTICKKGFFSSYWCSTKTYKNKFNFEFNYDYCAKINCESNKINYCQSNIFWSSTISNITLYFNHSENNYELILLRYDGIKDNCFVNKICRDCGAVNKILENQLKPCQIMKNDNQTIIIENLLETSGYSFYLIPVINEKTIGTLIKLDLHTEIRKPSDIIVSQRTMNSISLKWPNIGRNELEYSIEIKGDNYKQTVHTITTTFHFQNLLPCRKYCFSYWIINKWSQSIRSNFTCTNTEFKFGDIGLLSKYQNDPKSQLIKWNYNNENNCSVVFNVLYYPFKFPKKNVSHRTVTHFLNLTSVGSFGLYTFQVRPEIFNKYGKYSLEKDFLITETMSYSTITRKKKVNFSICGLAILVFLLISIIGFCTYKKVKRKKEINILQVEETEITKVEYFEVEGSMMCSKTNRLLRQFKNENYLKRENVQQEIINEFQNLILKSDRLKEKLNLTTNIAQLPENIKKNYNLSVVPYDQNRVTLHNHCTESGYYNASFIPFCEDANRKQFIACQAPIKECIFDFWLMIWQQNISLIIMLRKYNHKTKFCHYWLQKNYPNNIAMDSTEFVIELESETETDAYFERKFILSKKNENESRKITHLLMHSWSNFSNPDFEYLYNFYSRYNELTSIKSPPYLIHSNIEDDPTGVFIAIDRIINKINNKTEFIDVYNEVSELRRQRRSMVQEKSQYLYIYEFIYQFINRVQENEYILMSEQDL